MLWLPANSFFPCQLNAEASSVVLTTFASGHLPLVLAFGFWKKSDLGLA